MNNSRDKKEEYDVLPDDLLRDIARLKGCAVPEKGVPVATSILYPVSAAIAAEKRRKEEELIAALNGSGDASALIGKNVEGRGIFIGTWTPKGLSQTFNVFAAPEDLRQPMKYVNSVKHIARLRGWHGYNGTNYATDQELYKSLKNGRYKGGWIIPPLELLIGRDADATTVQCDNLNVHRNKGDLKGSFCTTPTKDGSSLPYVYWSSTADPGRLCDMWTWSFLDDRQFWDNKDGGRSNCRPVRLELKL